MYLLFNTHPEVGDPAGAFCKPWSVKYVNLLFASPVVRIVTDTCAVNALTVDAKMSPVTSTGEL